MKIHGVGTHKKCHTEALPVSTTTYVFIEKYISRYYSYQELLNPTIVSMVILSLPLIQEGQLSVSGDRMCTIPVNRLED